MLEANGTSAGGGTLVLVSDGKETEGPYIVDMMPTLMQKGVTVHTVCFLNEANQKRMNKLAADTKGTAFFDSGSWDSTGLWDAFTKTDTAGPGVASVEVCGLSVCRYVWTQCL